MSVSTLSGLIVSLRPFGGRGVSPPEWSHSENPHYCAVLKGNPLAPSCAESVLLGASGSVSSMRHFDTHAAQAIQQNLLDEARTAERREASIRCRLGLRLGLAARLSAYPERARTVTKPKPA